MDGNCARHGRHSSAGASASGEGISRGGAEARRGEGKGVSGGALLGCWHTLPGCREDPAPNPEGSQNVAGG